MYKENKSTMANSKNILPIVLLLINMFLFIGCGNKTPQNTSVYSVFVSDGDVYAVGNTNQRSSITDVPTLWKNGIPLEIGTMGNFNRATSVFVSEGIVYVTICEDDNAILWKNGERQILGPGDANCVFVDGTDVYVGGSSLWKNGIRQDFAGVANSVVIDGSDVYIAGYIGDFTNATASVWINGERIGYGRGRAKSISVSGNGDVYVVGEIDNEAAFWKNGVLQHLDYMGKSGASSIIVTDDGDVIVAGHAFDTQTLTPIAVIWVNGKAHRVDYLMGAESRALAYYNNLVYIGGESNDALCPVWTYDSTAPFTAESLTRVK